MPSIGLPRPEPPKSSTAILAATTEPGPPIAAYKLELSFITPMRTAFGKVWAMAIAGSNRTAMQPIAVVLNVFIRSSLGVLSLATPPYIRNDRSLLYLLRRLLQQVKIRSDRTGVHLGRDQASGGLFDRGQPQI